LGITLGGILGLDVLSDHNFTIDYRKRKIVFGMAAPTRNSVHFEATAPLPTLKATIDGQPVRLIPDSGTPGLVVFRNRITTGGFHLVEGPSISSVGGEARAQSFRANVMLGDDHLGARTVEIADVDVDSEAGFDGLLGFRAMGFRRVSFDFENGIFGWESGANQTSKEAASPLPLPVIRCGDGFHGNDCQSAIDRVALSVKQLDAKVAGWRLVVVPASRWTALVSAFRAKSTPAFSDLTTTSTYVNDALIFPQASMDEELRALTPLTGVSRLRWVLAHEYGHIVCHTRDETQAERAGGYLQYGKTNMCN